MKLILRFGEKGERVARAIGFLFCRISPQIVFES